MSGNNDEEDRSDEPVPPQPWHNSTPKLLGASIAALAAIALVITGVTELSRESSAPQEAPLDFVDPAFSASTTSDTATTTSPTITSTRPPLTTEINPGDPSSTTSSSESTSPSSTSGSATTTSESPTPRTQEDEDDSTPRTTRNRPRLNETRTLYPRPGG